MFGGYALINSDQYANSRNYEARLFLNANFRTNQDSKAKWLFNLFPKKENQNVLELGCGTGLFWLANRHSIPKSWQLTLTDYSEGMLEETKKTLSKVERKFNYEIVNAETIRYPDRTFDIILANNMLYHIDDKEKALAHIKRVLTNDGYFIPATQGKNDMIELNRLLYAYLEHKGTVLRFSERSFSLDNGLDQLKPYFTKIAVKRFKNSLQITEVDPIINYFLSFNGMIENKEILPDKYVEGFREYLHSILVREKSLPVRKEEGVFICSN